MKIKELSLLLDQDMALDVSGQVGWGEEISWQTEVHGAQLNPGLFLPEWPGNMHTKLRVQGKKNSEKLVAWLALDALSGTLRSFPLAGNGQIALDGKKIALKDLHLQSGSTQLDVDGQIDEQQVQVAVQARSDDLSSLLPDLQGGFEAKVEAQGEPMHPAIKLSLTGEALSFREHTLQHLQTNVQTNLHLEKGKQAAQVDEFRVVVNNKSALSATGTVGWTDGSVDPGQSFDLAFKAESTDVADLLPGAQGDFQLQGTLQGKGQEPQLDLTVNAGNIQYADYQLKQLNSKIKADLREQGEIAAHLDAVGIRVKEQEISTLSLDVHGKKEAHRLELALVGTPGKAQLSATGGLQEQLWQGQLTQLSLEHGQFGAWAMARPAAVHVSGQEAGLSHFSLQHKKMNIALNGAWKQEGGWQVKGGVNDFNLKLLQDWQLPVPDLSGIAQLSLTAQGKGAVPEQANFSFDLPQLFLTTEVFEDDKEEANTKVWNWTKNSIKIQLVDGTAHVEAHTQFKNKRQNQENNEENKGEEDSTAALEIFVENC
ncbi:MAG: hypothetical protein D3916_15355, partial [Candidatus Electrothrix sp. MAN1_4]|nr:hypothetical protein [Candidatus Electrothrix sp. MAN1_4]